MLLAPFQQFSTNFPDAEKTYCRIRNILLIALVAALQTGCAKELKFLAANLPPAPEGQKIIFDPPGYKPVSVHPYNFPDADWYCRSQGGYYPALKECPQFWVEDTQGPTFAAEETARKKAEELKAEATAQDIAKQQQAINRTLQAHKEAQHNLEVEQAAIVKRQQERVEADRQKGYVPTAILKLRVFVF